MDTIKLQLAVSYIWGYNKINTYGNKNMQELK
jgi:hypothetical protein